MGYGQASEGMRRCGDAAVKQGRLEDADASKLGKDQYIRPCSGRS
jgi:hypothetical protein